MKITRKKIISFIAKNGGAAGWSKAAAGVVSLALLAGGAGIFWNQLQEGTAFKPGKASALQGLRSNRVMFPEDDTLGGSADSEQSDKNDNKRLEQDKNAEKLQEGKKQENQPEPMEEEQSLMEVAQDVLVMQKPSDSSQNNTLPDGLDEKNMKVYDGTAADGDSFAEISLPGHGTGSGGASSGGNNGGSGSGGGTTNAGNTTGENGTRPGGNGNGGAVMPTPTPTPDPLPTPTPDPTPEPNQPIEDPDYPAGSEGPKLPEDVKGYLPIEADKYPSSGLPSDEAQSKVKLTIIDAGVLNSGEGETLYKGAVLTDWKLLCSVYAYVDVDGVRYRLTELNDCFKVEGYPNVAEGNFMAKFSFRQNPDVSWEDEKYADSVEYDKFEVKYGKIVLMGEADSDGKRETVKDTFMEEGKPVSIAKQLLELYRANPEWGDRFDTLSAIVPGLSLSEDGSDPIFDWFAPSQGGRYVLYPLERQPVPDGMEIRFYQEYSTECQAVICKQTLTGYQSQEIVEVPEGVYAIAPEDKTVSAGKLEIPASVMEINLPAQGVREKYEVSPENNYYSSADGLLYNKSQTEILGVPWEQTELVIPENVEKVVLEKGNSVRKLIIQTETIPEIDLNTLENTEIIVPAGHYAAYQLAWGAKLGNNTTLAADGETVDTIFDNNAVVSADGKTLYAISRDAYGLYRMSDQVETLENDATNVCSLEEGIYMPAGIKHLKKGSLSGAGVRRVYFTGDTPPKIEDGVFGDPKEALARGLEIIIPSAYEEAWQKALAPVLGEYAPSLIRPMNVSLEEEDSGLSYLLTADGAVLLHAPENTDGFENLKAKSGKPWIRIGAKAFEDCQSLSVAELPDTISEIGSWAFADCNSLDLIMIPCMDTVKIGVDPFPKDSSVAVNTQKIELEDASILDYIYLYGSFSCVAEDAEGDEYEINRWGLSYRLEKAEQGWFLFGIDKETDAEEDVSYLIGVTRDMRGAIRGAKGCPLRQIGYYTFRDHEKEFTIPDEVAAQIQFINPYAFYNSGLTGEVNLSVGMINVARYAFAKCDKLNTVRFDKATDLPEEKLILGESVFEGSGVKKIVFGKNMDSICSGTFTQCGELEEIVFTGEEEPVLVLFSVGAPYLWGWEDGDSIPAIILEGDAKGQEEAYINRWMYPILGYDSRETMENKFWMEAFQNIVEFLDDGQTMDWKYIDDYIAAKSELAEYEARKNLNPLFNLNEPEKPDVKIPNIKDYLYDEIEEDLPFELVLPDEIATNPDEMEIDEDFLIDDLPDEEEPDGEEPDGDTTDDDTPDDAETDEKTDEDSGEGDKEPSGEESDKDGSDEDNENKDNENKGDSDIDNAGSSDSGKGDNSSEKNNSPDEAGNTDKTGAPETEDSDAE